MAPKKRSRGDEQSENPSTSSSRVTRSSKSTRGVNVNTTPVKKKAKTKAKVELPLTKVVDGSKTIVIEHCKQCNRFKTRAIQVKNGLENAISEITVLVNPEKEQKRRKMGNMFNFVGCPMEKELCPHIDYKYLKTREFFREGDALKYVRKVAKNSSVFWI